jgi:hypothetical protein
VTRVVARHVFCKTHYLDVPHQRAACLRFDWWSLQDRTCDLFRVSYVRRGLLVGYEIRWVDTLN